MIKVIVFDFDDTLAHTFEFSYRLNREIAKRLGFAPLTRARFEKGWGYPMPQLLKISVPGARTADFRRVMRRIYPEYLGYLKPIPGLARTLSFLKKRRLKIALLTSGGRRYVSLILETLGVRKSLDYVLTADQTECHKPNPKVFQKILHYFKVQPGEVLYCGDLLLDLETARRAKINFSGVLSGITTQKKFINQGLSREKIIKDISELPRLFNKYFSI